MEEDEKKLTKKDLKLKAQEMKLQEKQKKMEEKVRIKEEKEKRKNSFERKVRNFFVTIIIVAILVVVGFYFGKEFLTNKEIELMNERMDQIYQSALLKIDSKEYREAIDLLKQIDEKYEKHEDVVKKINSVEQMYLNEYLTKADKYLNDEKYSKALDVLNSVEDEFKTAEVITDKIADIYVAQLKSDIKKIQNDDVVTIIEYIVSYNDGSFEKVKDEKETLISEYMNKFILETRERMKSDYEKAKSDIEEMIKILPDNKDIKILKDELSKFEPSTINLTSIKSSITSGKLKVSDGKDTVKDLAGNEYKNYILSSENQKDTTKNVVEYKLDKKYKELTGMICVSNIGNTNSTSVKLPRITIYNGDEVIYFSDKFSDDYANINFSVDLSDVNDLRIEFSGSSNISYFIANPVLTVAK